MTSRSRVCRFTILFAVVALTACLFAKEAAAQRNRNFIPLYAQFEGGGVTGDGIYMNGVGGVECNINPETGDFLLNLNGTARYLTFNLSGALLSGHCGLTGTNPGSFSAHAFMNVDQLLTVGAEGRSREAVFLTWQPQGDLHLGTPTGGSCTTRVYAVQTAGLTGGKRAWEIVSYTGSSAAALVQTRQTRPNRTESVTVGYFQLPFRLVVWEP
jgi:hypothetical protein